MNNVSYERRTVAETLEWLKTKAAEESEGRWTDFTAGDIGSVFLGLMAYLYDMTTFQIDKTTSELFLDTAVERSSIMSILKLIGYQPRHYLSAYTTITITADSSVNNIMIPKYSVFTNASNTISYTLLENIYIYNGSGAGVAYEGKRVVTNYQYNQITDDGKIYLADYKLGINTIELFISGVTSDGNGVQRVDDVRYSEGTFTFSAHVDEYGRVYIQLPTYWTDLITQQSVIQVSYLLTSGESGRIGANILTKPSSNISLSNSYTITNPSKSIGGYFPETADELKKLAPKQARTMQSIITKKDVKDLVSSLPLIADLKAGDYNDAWTNYIQPEGNGAVNDAYRCKVLAVPMNVNETSIFTNIQHTTYTTTAQEMIEFIDSRRVSSLLFEYTDAKRNVPDITIKLYIADTDLRKLTIASSVVEFIKQVYSRTYCTIGKSLPNSIIARDIHLAFSELDYIEIVGASKIEVDLDEYIDMYYAKFKVYVNDEIIINEL